MTKIGRVAIVGAGQLGTMIGAALLEAGPSAGVAAVGLYDIDPEVAAKSVSLGGGDRVLLDPVELLGANAVVLAIPLGEILSWLKEYGPQLGEGVLLVDAGSAKVAVVEAMADFVPEGVHAVGGHPMAGSEASGPGAALPGNLRGANFALCPCRTDEEALERARSLVSACGARSLVLAAAEHDRLAARTSHLPHLVAGALAVVVAAVADDLPLTQALAGTGYRSTTRLAASDSEMVAAFASANLSELEGALREFRQEMDHLETALADGPKALATALEKGRTGRALVLGLA
jgi:prephenate dehydrogenase